MSTDADLTPQPEPVSALDTRVVRLREYTAAGLAAVVVIGMVILVVAAAAAGGSAENFDRLKDLLLFLNPLVGIVIGYYFNRVTSERRAENAETAARQAGEVAIGADRGRVEAEDRAQETASSLADLARAVDSDTRAGAGTLGAGAGVRPELQAALDRANAVLSRRATGR